MSAIDPFTGKITLSQFAGSEPDALAISGDAQYVYVGLDGSAAVQRFVLPSLSTDINYSLGANSFFGPYFALDLQVAPGSPHTTAVTRGASSVSPEEEGGIEIFDDANVRPTIAAGFSSGGGLYDSLQWGSDATVLYAANNEDTGFDFYTLTVSPTGVVPDKDYPGAFSLFFIRIHYDSGTQLIYSDDGHIIAPSTGLPAGQFAASGIMVPDSTLNTAFFIGQTQSQVGGANFTIESFNLTTFTPLDSVVVTGVSGGPMRLIRWGTDGLAFNTSGGQIFIISDPNFVISSAEQLVRPNRTILRDHVQRTWSGSHIHYLPKAFGRTAG